MYPSLIKESIPSLSSKRQKVLFACLVRAYCFIDRRDWTGDERVTSIPNLNAELLDNPAFAPVVSDIDGNITVRAPPPSLFSRSLDISSVLSSCRHRPF